LRSLFPTVPRKPDPRGKKPPTRRPISRLEALEDRLTPTVTLSIADPVPLTEGDTGSTNMVFTVTRSGDTGPSLTVQYQTVDGTAHAGTDYTATSGTLSFASGQTTATISVPVLGDTLDEPDEAFTVTLSNALAGSSTGPAPTFAAQVTFAVGSDPEFVAIGDLNGDGKPDLVAANESTPGVISVLLNTTTPGATTPTFATQHTFAVGNDCRGIAIGDVNGDGLLDLAVVNNSQASVSVLLNTMAPGATTASFAAQATFAVGTTPYTVVLADVNGDGKPDLVTANAANDNASVLLNTTTPGATTPTFAAQATFAVGDNPYAVAVADLNGDGRPDLVAANKNAGSISVLLNTGAPGAAPSFAGQVTFAVGTNPYYVAIADVNGDGKPDLAVANHGSTFASVLLNTAAPGAAAPGFAAQSTFAIGANSYAVALADINGDGKPDLVVADTSNRLSVLSNSTPATITAGTATGTIVDNDPAPTLSVNSVSVAEGNAGTTSATFTVTLSAASGQTVTVDFATADGTATAADGDYVPVTGTVTFAPGQTTRTFTVTVNGDTRNEADETFVVNLSAPTNASIATGTGTGTITNDDPVPTLSVDSVTVAEGNAGTTTATFTVTLSAASGQTVTVSAATADGTATAPGDYVALAPTLVTFAPGVTTQTVTVTVNGDALDEADETFTVNLSAPTNATIGTGTGTGTITDDDAPPGVSLSLAGSPFDEEGGVATVTVTLSAVSAVDVTVTLGFSGTGTFGTDYTASATTVTIPAGTLSADVTLTGVGDRLTEPAETVVVDVSGVTNGTETGQQQVTATVTSDDVTAVVAVGGGGGSPVVRVLNPDGSTRFALTPFGAGFLGGIHVATGDVNGDQVDDLIVAPGAGGGPHVKVYDGVTGAEIDSFFAYNPAFTGGVFVGTADVDGDGKADIITGAGPGATPHVKVFSGATGAELFSFFAFGMGFTGGVTVAGGDVTGDGRADIITGAGPGSPGGHVKVFDEKTGAEIRSFFAYAQTFSGGVFVAAGDLDGDGKAEVITGVWPGGSPHVKVFDGGTNKEVFSFFAFAPTATGGVRVAAADRDGDGLDDLVLGSGSGSQVKVLSGLTLAELSGTSGTDALADGVFVG
jgi:hypothetical protein